MRGDFSRDTFDASKHFLRVLMQQGRVQLDTDWNEQVAILLHYLQNLAADLIGPYGGPGDIIDEESGDVLKKNQGFELITEGSRIDKFAELSAEEKSHLKDLLSKGTPQLLIGKGHYYVDGILCENEDYILHSKQPDWPYTDLAAGSYLVYLDVWERHITFLEDTKFPSIREIALGGPDTATRAKVVWQVKTTDETPEPDPDNLGSYISLPSNATCDSIRDAWQSWKGKWQPAYRGSIIAKGKEPTKKDTVPCIISPEARYRGAENQLYRIEIHQGGIAETATFKWSRDNGSIIFPILAMSGNTITLEQFGQDNRRTLGVGNWVEIIDDDYALQDPLQGQPRPLLQVENIDLVDKVITFSEGTVLPAFDSTKHPLLRRWESEDIVIIEGSDNDQQWFDLEDGVRILFQEAATGSHKYRSGDYWLIPGRSTTGDILWPTEKDISGKLGPSALPPHGIEHHYAPLAIISVTAAGQVTVAHDCRCPFNPPCAAVAESVEVASIAKETAVPKIVTAAKPKAGTKPRARTRKRK